MFLCIRRSVLHSEGGVTTTNNLHQSWILPHKSLGFFLTAAAFGKFPTLQQVSSANPAPMQVAQEREGKGQKSVLRSPSPAVFSFFLLQQNFVVET